MLERSDGHFQTAGSLEYDQSGLFLMSCSMSQFEGLAGLKSR